MKKLIAVIGFFASLVSHAQQPTLEPGQIYSTPNVVLPTVAGSNSTPWVNGVYQDNLTCWGWGNPGYCGPNAIVRPGNNINFSFGQTDLYQSQAIANVLPNSGSGLRVNGYNFSFLAKNGNGWDNGRVDYLYAYTHLTNQNNQVVHHKTYNLSYKFDWTSFNYSETFNTPFASKDLKNVTYGFVGRDNNGWAGPYGPEIYNVSFSLKYSVDPCSVNVLSSPTCPGYLEELAKLTPASSTTTATIETTPTTTASITTDTSNPVVVQYSAPSSTNVTASQTAPAPVASSSSSSSTTSTTTATAAVSQPSSTREVNTNALSIGLSVVARNQQREQALALQTAQNAVTATEQTAQQAQQEAVSVAQSASTNSASFASNPVARQAQIATRAEAATISVGGTSQTSSVALFTNPSQTQVRAAESRASSQTFTPEILTPPVVQAAPVASSAVSQVASQTVSTPVSTIVEQVSSSQQSATYSLLPPPPPTQTISTIAPVAQESRENNQSWGQQLNNQTLSSSTEFQLQENNRFLTDRTNPINALLNERSIEPQSSQSGILRSSVNSNASNNEVAGGVDLNRMAVSPAGYNQYLNLVIADAAFYAPKEVYRNQRNVDNVRALRSLSSDRLHQEMVDQQYRK